VDSISVKSIARCDFIKPAYKDHLRRAEALRSLHSIIIVCNHYDMLCSSADDNDDNDIYITAHTV